jgi:L-asparaginase
MRKILIIYTGGTIGMAADPATNHLIPIDFNQLIEQVPELAKFHCQLDNISFENPIDSSDIDPQIWIRLARIFKTYYDSYDGFVILHGTDTMAYTASALSFMLKGLNKPVIITGSQLPIGVIRTDGKENLITAIEIAADMQQDRPIVSEVAIYFEYKLYRGNRTIKQNAEHFNAFRSPNYPYLAEAGMYIHYNTTYLKPWKEESLEIYERFEQNIAVVKLFPGITEAYLSTIIHMPHLKGLIFETFGSGNAPTAPFFERILKSGVDLGVLMVNITQCAQGFVQQGRYRTSSLFNKYGVIGGLDLTLESAVVKLMMVLSMYRDLEQRTRFFLKDWAGEITLSSPFIDKG